MSPILGIMASQITGHLVTNSYESIATYVAPSSQSSVTFSSIASTYKHLQIRFSLTNTTTDYDAILYFNGDTTNSNYRSHYLRGDGSNAASGTYAVPYLYATSQTYPTAGVVDILDYTNTNKNTTTRALAGFDKNGSGVVYLNSTLWLNTNAVSSITISADATQFATGSHFALYGIK